MNNYIINETIPMNHNTCTVVHIGRVTIVMIISQLIVFIIITHSLVRFIIECTVGVCTLDNTILISFTNVLVGMVIFIIACVHFCFLLSIAFSLPSSFLPLFLLPFFSPFR